MHARLDFSNVHLSCNFHVPHHISGLFRVEDACFSFDVKDRVPQFSIFLMSVILVRDFWMIDFVSFTHADIHSFDIIINNRYWVIATINNRRN
jgi:hypothetical protein